MNKFNLDIFIWTMFFYLSNLYYTGNPGIIMFFGMSLVLVICLITYRTLKVKKGNIRVNKVVLCLWLIFAFTVLVTNLINNENVVYAILLNTIIPYFFIYKAQYYKSLKSIILKSILLSSVLLILNGFGFFNILSINTHMQSNSMGLFMITFSIYTLYKFYYSDSFMFLVLLNLLLVILSSSRTALVSFILTLIVVVVLKIVKTNLAKSILRIYFTLSTLVLTVLILLVNKDKILEIDVINKIAYYSSDGNNLNGRDTIWSYIINNVNFSGHSLDILYSMFNLSPHNNFLSILFTNGIIAFIFFALINLLMLFKSMKNFIKNQDSIFNFIMMMGFILTSMTEYYYSIFGISLVFLWYIYIGDIMFNKYPVRNYKFDHSNVEM